MCKGGGALGFDRKSRAERWGVASDDEIRATAQLPGLVWLDVRTEQEAVEKPLPPGLGAKRCNVTMFSSKELEAQASSLLPNKAAHMVVLCAGGGRAEVAIKALKKLGYTGTLTNGGMLSDLEEAIPEVIADAATAPAKKSKSSCVVM